MELVLLPVLFVPGGTGAASAFRDVDPQDACLATAGSKKTAWVKVQWVLPCCQAVRGVKRQLRVAMALD